MLCKYNTNMIYWLGFRLVAICEKNLVDASCLCVCCGGVNV